MNGQFFAEPEILYRLNQEQSTLRFRITIESKK